MDLKEIGINMRKWVDSAQDRYYWKALVNAALKAPGSINHGVSSIVKKTKASRSQIPNSTVNKIIGYANHQPSWQEQWVIKSVVSSWNLGDGRTGCTGSRFF